MIAKEWTPASAQPIHLTVRIGSRLRSRAGLVVHERVGLRMEPPAVVHWSGLAVVGLERAVLESWALLPGSHRREPAIIAVRHRLTTPARLRAEMIGAPRLPGRPEQRHVLRMLAKGCHSGLELWGHDEVFAGPEFAGLQRQVRVRVGGRAYYLDLFCPLAQLAIELDGAAYHGSADDRERDDRRDTALASVGIQVIRFSHRRLVREPAVVRAETLAVLEVRRAAVAQRTTG